MFKRQQEKKNIEKTNFQIQKFLTSEGAVWEPKNLNELSN